MRWEGLFTDLEAQAVAMERSERAAEIEDRTRIEVGSIGLLERLRPALGTALQLRCVGEFSVSGILLRVATEWVLIDGGQGRETLVALGSVLSVAGLGRLSAAPGSGSTVESRLGLRHALRRIAGDRSVVQLSLCDASTIAGTIDRVGKDFVELTVHDAGELRRRGDVCQMQLVRLGALVALRRDSQC
jgi:hypothetical protein